MRIRAATLADSETISTLAMYNWMSTYSKEGMSPTMASFLSSEYSPARYRTHLKKKGRLIWVVQHKKRLAGFCEIALKTPYESTCASTRLETCYLHCPVEGEDVCQELFDHAIQELRTYQITDLWVSLWQQEEENIQWYTELGFKQVGEYFLEMDGSHYKHLVLDNCSE